MSSPTASVKSFDDFFRVGTPSPTMEASSVAATPAPSSTIGDVDHLSLNDGTEETGFETGMGTSNALPKHARPILLTTGYLSKGFTERSEGFKAELAIANKTFFPTPSDTDNSLDTKTRIYMEVFNKVLTSNITGHIKINPRVSGEIQLRDCPRITDMSEAQYLKSVSEEAQQLYTAIFPPDSEGKADGTFDVETLPIGDFLNHEPKTNPDELRYKPYDKVRYKEEIDR
ncbi:uncharacterized protein L199_001116 [Kwoniella botswanensis]|uniref:uncharacterized protein n=1 Tax=Kwoniella botswanensis TaxID=1268659 RepID=UPI00315D30A2